MQPDQRRLAARRADHQRDMLFAIVAGAEGDDLGLGKAVERQIGARDDGRLRCRSSSKPASTRAAISTVGSINHRAGSKPARRARVSAATASGSPSISRVDSGPIGARSMSRPASTSARAAPSSSQSRAHDPHRTLRIGRIKPVAQSERSRPSAADQQHRRPLADRPGRASPGSRFRPTGRRSAPPLDHHRAPGTQRSDRALDGRRVGHTRNSLTSGTWSDGRSHDRHGSSTRCVRRLRREAGRGPHMVEPPPAIVGGPVLRPIAPPGEQALGRGDEAAAEIDPVVRRLQPPKRLDLDRRMADDVEQRLVAPHVAFQRRDVEVADDQSRLSQLFRPAGHALDKVEFLAEFGVEVAVGNVAAGRDIDILEADAAVEPGADMARLAIVLPVVAPGLVQRQLADDRDAMMHLLAVEQLMDIAAAAGTARPGRHRPAPWFPAGRGCRARPRSGSARRSRRARAPN